MENSLLRNSEKNNKIIYMKIIKELEKLNYNYSHIGTRYLAMAIYLFYVKNLDNLERDIYPIIAKKYRKTVNNIKCNIINATSNMYMDCKEETLERYFGAIVKPTPKFVIYEISEKIRI